MTKSTKATRRYVIGAIGALITAAWASTASAGGQAPAAPAPQTGASVETPRRANGVPDFSGVWVPTRRRGAPIVGGFVRFNPETNTLTLPSRTSNPVDFERDFGVAARVQFSDVHGHSVKAPDPEFQCMPPGVPRAGMPEEIVQTDRHMVFVHGHVVRRIYLDGRPHPPEDQWLGTWWGHSVGRWEGDTLVISTVDFNGLEWLGWPGWITSPRQALARFSSSGTSFFLAALLRATRPLFGFIRTARRATNPWPVTRRVFR